MIATIVRVALWGAGILGWILFIVNQWKPGELQPLLTSLDFHVSLIP